ncbi:sensor histidine kinase [Actinoplanes sp. HUAS TT8]|uniref:sensor histidine kinase n=1 Tax=Actinoplanes sp. HUAS TT8 TaxID=3447453 RepID=UPI003F524C55
MVTRRTSPDSSPTVVKRATGPGAVRRIEHERAILQRLAGVPGVPRLAARQPRQCLVLLDDGGAPPEPGPMPVPELVHTAHDLAGTLAAVHRAGVLHRDITPANIVLRPDAPPVLIDYDLALAGTPEPDEGPVGTLGYLAPEQTGRTGLTTDRRADLYGLGATVYALATGAPPFPGTDQLDVVRATLVATPPAPDLPPRLSAIVMRLLEKDPDRRYQSADGLVHDLARFFEDPDGRWELGERDFPAVLPPPAALVGRDREMRALAMSLDRAMVGGTPAVLVSGPAGIGKSALVQTLRPLIGAYGGWFVAGKYEQFRTGTDSGGIARMIRALGRLLLAEPEQELAEDRKRILAALGPNAAVLSGIIPEMAALMGFDAPPFPGDPLTAPTRLSTTLTSLMRAVAERRRLVVLVDDLQWASASSLRILDGMLTDGPMPGLLVVIAYRDEQVDAEHPLAPLVARWQRDGLAGPPLRVTGLNRAGIAALAGVVLRLAPGSAAELADLIGTAGAGNPYAIVELINALRGEGLLTPAPSGWAWDPREVRQFVARHRLPQILAVRLEQQPPPTRDLLTALTCLGADVRPELLALATGTLPATLPARLAPAVADGLISVDGPVRFRHDLVLQAARELLPAAEIEQLQLTMARRLAAHGDFTREAAEQFLAVAGLVTEEKERRTAAGLLHAAGRRTTRLTNYLVAEELFAAADRLLAPLTGEADRATRDALAVDRHAALYYLGRHAEADQIYRELSARPGGPVATAGATAVQINSLTQRGECRAAIALGLDTLRRFGLEPPADLVADNLRVVTEMRDWVAVNGPDYPDVETHDPRIEALAAIVHRMLTPTFLIDPVRHAWLVGQAHLLWLRNGVCAPLTGTLGAAICVTIGLLDDYRTGYLLTRHAAETGRRHGYQAETAIATYMHLMLAAHWFTPLEEVVESARQTRDDLLTAGDVQVAGLHCARLLTLLLETEESLEACAEETDGVLAFADRTGNHFARLIALGHRQLIRLLRGRSGAPGSFAADDFDEGTYLAEVAGFPPALATYHQKRALGALLTGDAAALDTHSAAAMAQVGAIRGFYATVLTHVTRCLSLAGTACAQPAGPAAPEPAAELHDAREWLARRAAESPHNLGPLLLLVDAEIARGRGDTATALRCFDDGLHAVEGRPWHHALLAERAARLHLELGLTHTGRQLLTEARDAYRAWGAEGPVARLETEHPFLRNTASSAPGSGADRLDLMAILRASRALSSQTTVSGLTAQVGDVLSAMTGATDVHLALRRRADSQWHTGTPHTGLPLSAIRYVQRTHQPLLVADATCDDRFAADPYVQGLEVCALLVTPVVCHNAEAAVLVLANHRQRGVFSTGRLESVELIAGQLAVFLDNALLYDSLESQVRARTAELADRNRDLESANQLKADLIGMLGHEINNPLGSILGYLGLVLDGDPLPPSAAEMITRVQTTTRRLVTIVDEVLALVSIDAGRLTAAPRPVRVAEHIEAALGATGTTAATVSCPRDLTASAQPGHLDQILTNLISNAAKYGGGVSTIVARRSNAGPVTVEVADQGPGVPPEFRNRLFDRFARAERTAGKVAGTGLGLYIVRELARANGGDVQYRPEPVRGSAFIVSLPPVTMGPHPDMR